MLFAIGYLAFGAAFYSWLFLWAEAERGEPCAWSKWSGRVVLLFVVAVLLAMLSGCSEARADGPQPPAVYVDPMTRCHYLSTGHDSGLTPRMDRDGKQVCK